MPSAMTVIGLAIVLANSEPAVSSPQESTAADDSVQDDHDRAVTALGLAQAQAAAGNTDAALQSLRVAIEWDPSIAALYLTRAQVLVGLLGEPMQAPDDPASRRVWSERAEQAVSDLDRYIELAAPDRDVRRLFEKRRNDIQVALDIARTTEVDRDRDPDLDPDRDPDPDSDPPGPGATRLPGLLLVGSGSLLSAGAVAAFATGLQIHPRCRGSVCPSWTWTPQPAGLSAGTSLTVVGTALVTAGAVLLARRGPSIPTARRKRRTLATLMLVSAGVSLVTSATLGGVSAQRAGRDVDDTDGLSRTQSMANASLAIGSLVLPLVGGGIGFGLPPRRR